MSNLNAYRLDSDDPRLTAFALGELKGDELAGVAAAVAADPTLQAAVDEIRATAGQLEAALKEEPLPAPVRPIHLEPYRTVRPPRMFALPYWAVAGLAAAACFVVLLTLRQLPHANQELPRTARTRPNHGNGAGKASESQIAGQQQAGNQFVVVFPKSEGDAPSTPGGATDDWGVVVPNAPQTAADAAGVAEPGPAGGAVAADRGVAIAAMPAAPSQDRSPGTSEADGAGPDHPFVAPGENPVSSFPLAAGNSGYADVRRCLLDGHRPPPAMVRLEELVNSFAYDYAPPKPEDKEPIAASMEVASAPWAPRHRLVRIALKAREPLPGAGVGVVARNVVVQVLFDPAQVQAYRLLGYENPGRGKENGNRDTSGATDIKSGHTITVFYEIVPMIGDRTAETGDRKAEGGERIGDMGDGKLESGDRKGESGKRMAELADALVSGIHNAVSKGLMTVRVRYQVPEGSEDRSLEFPVVDKGTAFAGASRDFRFAAAVAEFGLVMRDSPYKSGATLEDVLHWAEPAAGPDAGGARCEFITLVKRAEAVLQAPG